MTKDKLRIGECGKSGEWRRKDRLIGESMDALNDAGYSDKESMKFIKSCKIVHKNGIIIWKAPVRLFRECVREARKERRIY